MQGRPPQTSLLPLCITTLNWVVLRQMMTHKGKEPQNLGVLDPATLGWKVWQTPKPSPPPHVSPDQRGHFALKGVVINGGELQNWGALNKFGRSEKKGTPTLGSREL